MRKDNIIKKGLEIANSGIFKKENIEIIIKADFMNNYHSTKNLMSLYKILANKYGKSSRTIMTICNF
jgi:hypothetical protein